MELFSTVCLWFCFQYKAMDQSVSIESQIAASGIDQRPLGSSHNPQQMNNLHPPSHLQPPSGHCVNHVFCTTRQCITVIKGTFPIYSPRSSNDRSCCHLGHFKFSLCLGCCTRTCGMVSVFLPQADVGKVQTSI